MSWTSIASSDNYKLIIYINRFVKQFLPKDRSNKSIIPTAAIYQHLFTSYRFAFNALVNAFLIIQFTARALSRDVCLLYLVLAIMNISYLDIPFLGLRDTG